MRLQHYHKIFAFWLSMFALFFSFHLNSEAGTVKVSNISGAILKQVSTLDSAFAYIDLNGTGIRYIITISDTVTEASTATLPFHQISKYSSIKIVGDTANTNNFVIGDVAGPLVQINKGHNICIDGGLRKNLTFQNLDSLNSSSVIFLNDSASNDTIRNVNISCGWKGDNTTFTYGILAGKDLNPITGSLFYKLLIENNTFTKASIGVQIFGDSLRQFSKPNNVFVAYNYFGMPSDISQCLGKYGVNVQNVCYALIFKNEIDSIINPVVYKPAGIYVHNCFTDIVANKIHDISYYGLEAKGAYGIHINNSDTFYLHSRNNLPLDSMGYIPFDSRISYPNLGFKNMASEFAGLIANNVIYNIDAKGSSSEITENTYGIIIEGNAGYEIIHNSINLLYDLSYNSSRVLNKRFTAVGFASALMFAPINSAIAPGLIKSSSVFNNSFSAYTTGFQPSTYHAYSMIIRNREHISYCNYNCYWNGKLQQDSLIIYSIDNATAYIYNNTSWQAYYIKDQDSKMSSPLYVNKTDLRPKNSSPLIGSGICIYRMSGNCNIIITKRTDIDVDIVDSLRTEPPTIGAYEHWSCDNSETFKTCFTSDSTNVTFQFEDIEAIGTFDSIYMPVYLNGANDFHKIAPSPTAHLFMYYYGMERMTGQAISYLTDIIPNNDSIYYNSKIKSCGDGILYPGTNNYVAGIRWNSEDVTYYNYDVDMVSAENFAINYEVIIPFEVPNHTLLHQVKVEFNGTKRTNIKWDTLYSEVFGARNRRMRVSYINGSIRPGRPIQFKPLNKTKLVNLDSINFSWCLVESAQYYKLEISTDPNFTNMVTSRNVDTCSKDTINYKIASLPAGNYYWRVGAYRFNIGNPNAPDTTYYSPSRKFTTKIITSPIVSISYINPNGANSVTIKGNVDSPGGDAIVSRWFRYGTDSTLSNIATSDSTFIKSINNLACGTKYYFRAYAANFLDTGFSAIQSFKVGLTISGRVRYGTSNPLYDTAYGDRFVDSVKIVLFRGNNRIDSVVSSSGLDTGAYKFTGLCDTTYYIKAYNTYMKTLASSKFLNIQDKALLSIGLLGKFESDSCGSTSLQLLTKIQTIASDVNADGSLTSDNIYYTYYYNGIKFCDSSVARVSSDPFYINNDVMLIRRKIPGLKDTAWKIPNFVFTDTTLTLNKDTAITIWCLAGGDINGSLTKANLALAKSGDPDIEDLQNNAEQNDNSPISVYPSPFDNSLNITANIGCCGNAKINLIDMLGNVVLSKDCNIRNGVLDEKLDVSSNLASGMYMLVVITDNGMYSTKVTKLK